MAPTLIMDFVKELDVLVGRYGMDQDVLVHQGIIGMELSVYCA